MSNFIKTWTQKEVEVLARRFKRYSVLVFILKFILPLSAVGLIITMIVSSNQKDQDNLRLEPVKTATIAEKPAMENPRFHGMDAKNQPYNIIAKKAVQEGEKSVLLEGITADITLEGGKWVSLVADKGIYSFDTEYLNLSGLVNIYITSPSFNAEITTNGAEADVKKSIVSGKNGIKVDSDIGQLTASGFVIDSQTQKLTFTGPVKLIIMR